MTARKRKAVEVSDLPKRYQAQARAQISSSVQKSNDESDQQHGEVEPLQILQDGERCRIEVRGKRRRPCDPDNIHAKPHIDALRYRLLLPDDNPKWVKEVRLHAEEKVRTHEEEETTIEIWRV